MGDFNASFHAEVLQLTDPRSGRKPQRGYVFVVLAITTVSRSDRSGIFRPDGAWCAGGRLPRPAATAGHPARDGDGEKLGLDFLPPSGLMSPQQLFLSQPL
jgi:hypothetical protein